MKHLYFVILTLSTSIASLAQAKASRPQELICRQTGPYYDTQAAIRLSADGEGTYQFQTNDYTNGVDTVEEIEFGTPLLTHLPCSIDAKTFAVKCLFAQSSHQINSAVQLWTEGGSFLNRDNETTTIVNLHWLKPNDEMKFEEARVYYFEGRDCRAN